MYQDGCSWKVRDVGFVSEQLILRGSENSESFPVKCEVGNQLLLDALVSIYGERVIYVGVYRVIYTVPNHRYS